MLFDTLIPETNWDSNLYIVIVWSTVLQTNLEEERMMGTISHSKDDSTSSPIP